MATVSQMIAALGGVRKSAAVLGVPPTTVQHWKRHDRVPAWRARDLADAYAAAAPHQPETPPPFATATTGTVQTAPRKIAA